MPNITLHRRIGLTSTRKNCARHWSSTTSVNADLGWSRRQRLKRPLRFREWQRSRVNEIADMSECLWEFMFKELTAIPSKDKKFNRAPESVKGPRKAA